MAARERRTRGADGAGVEVGGDLLHASTGDGAVEIAGEGGLDGGAGVEFHRAARSWRSRSWRWGTVTEAGRFGWSVEKDLPEGGAAAGEAGLDGAEVDVEDFGDLFVGEALRSRGGRRRCGRLRGARGGRLRRARGARPGRRGRRGSRAVGEGGGEAEGSSSSSRLRAWASRW